MSAISKSWCPRSLIVSIAAWGAVFGQPNSTPAFSRTITQAGTTIAVDVAPVDAAASTSAPLRELENVLVRLRFTDNATESPLAGGSPAAWFDRRPGTEQTTSEQCIGKVKRFAEGSTFSHTELDLTSYFVVIMNTDSTLTVVDPRFGYGDTRLLALVSLSGPGEDWALKEDGQRLFVSVPSANQVVSIDTASWKVVGIAEAIPAASRVALQPDEGYLWVGYGATEEDSGVAVLTPRDMKIVAKIRTGRGYHHIAFAADSSFAFVTNPNDGTVSVIDVRKLAKERDVAVGSKPVWIAYSDLAKAAYVANEGDGKIVAIDSIAHNIRAAMTATPGLGQIRFAPGGRYALAVNPVNNMIYVADSATNRIVQQGKLESAPDQIAFTNKQAHIRHRGSDSVLMIALASLGGPDSQISVADFSGGRHAPGEMSRPTPADGIVQASGENGVLVANPGDKSVYFYMEGNAAPMGNLSNYGHEPRAVLSVERNLRERAPGVYETTTTLPGAGSYDLAVFLDRPRVISCFDVSIAPDPARRRPVAPKVTVEPRIAGNMKAGQTARLAFRLTFAGTGQPAAGHRDIVILMAGPQWQNREAAVDRGDGVYSVDFRVPLPGTYTVFLAAPSLGLSYAQYATVNVTPAAN
jgi:YVTN family beta-propeller protein